ncbi:MAG: dinitrogenase iron-molybdenum cofactor biosynthesis protein [Firmicutes bacterium HGW-Firmicutes-19]|jgi:predicted Fe-Mo cluster-binding NifX family protein|nr:MAG: dinitrogenase iron-molybdenum cofactor biosynthesis protein [Firmicutes bacterium HGW-Firmicutes-19]
MKIAVASMQEEVSQHFGHCEKFKVFTIVDNAVTSVEEIINPAQHSHGQLPAMLMQYGVNIVIAGGIGTGAKQLLQKADILVYSGVNGNVEEAVHLYLSGKLVDANTDCGHHHGDDHNHGQHNGHHH